MNLSYAKLRFREQRKISRIRGIDFQLTFDEWYNWWLSNGVDRNIPRKHNGNILCMCRFNDTGPYSLNNIYCASLIQNNKDAHKFNPQRKGHTKLIHTPKGIFPSKIKAANFFNVHTTTISKWLKSKPTEFYYV